MLRTSLSRQGKAEGYKCDICSLILPRLHLLRVHLRDVHKENAFQCETCKERLPSWTSLKSHVKIHTSVENDAEDTTFASKHGSLQTAKRKCAPGDSSRNVSQSCHNYLLKDLSSVQSCSKRRNNVEGLNSNVPSICIVSETKRSASQEKYNGSKSSVFNHPEAEKDMLCIPEEYLLMELKQEEDTSNFIDGEVLNNNDINMSSFSVPPPLDGEQNLREMVEILKVELNNEELEDESSLVELPDESENSRDECNIKEELPNNDPDPISVNCSFCDKTFCDAVTLAAHEDEHESDDGHDSQLDTESHDYLSKLKGSGEFTCDKCPVSFPRLHLLKMHSFKIHGDNRFECLICGEKCPTRQLLTKHKQVHVVDGFFKCETCGVSQAKYSNFLRHLKLHSGTRDYTCEWCGQSFTTSTVLIRHRRRHTGEKPYSCDECGERFARLYGLKVHQSKHVGRSYFCSESNCSKGFYSKSALNNHLKSHLPERPYKCVACGCGFYMSSHYKDHLRKHTGEKSFVCEICNKPFARKAELIVHFRVHTGERPFVCSDCDKTFTSLTALKHHSATHTKSKGSKCTECEQVFKTESGLKRHIKCAHNPNKSDLSDDSFTLYLSEDEENNVDSPESLEGNIHQDNVSEKCESDIL